MKVVRMMLIGSVLSILFLASNGVVASDRFAQSFVNFQTVTLDISIPQFNDINEAGGLVNGFDADFLLAHQLADGYTMGVKYLDYDYSLADELHQDIDHSQLWIGLQLSF